MPVGAVEGKFNPLSDKEIGISRQWVELRSEALDQNAFQVLRISESERNDIYYVETGVGILSKFMNVLKSGRKEKLTHGAEEEGPESSNQFHFFCGGNGEQRPNRVRGTAEK